MIVLRDYQAVALDKINKVLTTKNDVVLAASPSSGKTIMALKFIQNTTGKVLILTHGQNQLKDMWAAEIDKHLSKEDKKRVIYGLPQSLKNKDIPKVNFVIVDEAHEFTFASMVKAILEKNKHAKRLYLTGTPSPFIEKGYDVVVVPAMELIQKGFISDLYVALFSTTAKIRNTDRNELDDVTEKGAKKLEATVNKDLDNLLEAMTRRLKAQGFIKKRPLVARAMTKWDITTGILEKTMIACTSIKQAAKVEAYFKSKKIGVVSSNSVNDPDSENIKRFQEDKSIKVLVVVDRAILGFNMPDLVNVVDMTCSLNINRIYQLYARVMRKNDKHPNKYFFKLNSRDESEITKFFMTAALCLTREDFISKYNGKNLSSFSIPVMKVKRKKEKREKTNGKKKQAGSRIVAIDPSLEHYVGSVKFLDDVWNKSDGTFNEYARCNLSQFRRQALGEEVMEDFSTWDMIMAFIRENPHESKRA